MISIISACLRWICHYSTQSLSFNVLCGSVKHYILKNNDVKLLNSDAQLLILSFPIWAENKDNNCIQMFRPLSIVIPYLYRDRDFNSLKEILKQIIVYAVTLIEKRLSSCVWLCLLYQTEGVYLFTISRWVLAIRTLEASYTCHCEKRFPGSYLRKTLIQIKLHLFYISTQTFSHCQMCAMFPQVSPSLLLYVSADLLML